MTALAQRRTWAPVYTASRWSTLLDGMRSTLDARGNADAMTNAEAVSFIREWNNVSHGLGKLAWQFAAVAYGWDPKRDTLNRSSQQSERWYPMTPEVFAWAGSIARELDERADQPPRIAVDRDTFRDPTFYGHVREQLQQDGARAAFKIPTGMCKDKSGKARPSRPPCDKNGRGPLMGYDRAGKPVYAPCDKPGDCEPELLDDPVTHVGNQLTMLLLVVGAVWLLTRGQPRTRHG